MCLNRLSARGRCLHCLSLLRPTRQPGGKAGAFSFVLLEFGGIRSNRWLRFDSSEGNCRGCEGDETLNCECRYLDGQEGDVNLQKSGSEHVCSVG